MLENKKVYVGKHSREIQEKAFELGYEWRDDGKKITCLNKPFLYFYDGGIMTCGTDIVDFNNHDHNEITVEEILAMVLPPPKKTWEELTDRDVIVGFNVDDDVMKIGALMIEKDNPDEVFFTDLLPTKQEAYAVRILPTLLWWRNKYNEGWRPDYNDSNAKKYVISVSKNRITLDHTYTYSRLFSFKNGEIRDKFFSDFKEELEIVKPLL